MKNSSIFLSSIFLFVLATSILTQAQGDLPPSLARGVSIDQVETLFMPHDQTIAATKANHKTGLPLWAGFSIEAGVDSHTQGTKIKWPTGDNSWMLRATSPGAPALALVFEDVEIPKNATFFVYSESNPTASYSIKGSELSSKYVSTPPLPGDAIVIEYHEPPQGDNLPTIMSTAFGSFASGQSPAQLSGLVGSFSLTDLVVIYNGLESSNREKNLGSSGPCMVNINCSPEGANWQVFKRGVARILLRVGSSWYHCSGSLINNTAQNGTPYFLTAAHCGQGATAADMNVWQFFFNYERAQCGNFGTPPNHVITGCTLMALGPLAGGSDFRLVQLNSTPPQSFNPYYNGWNRSAVGAMGGVGIHHPSGDAKKISTFTGTLYSATPNIEGSVMAPGGAWGVVWVATTNGHSVTEGGSSGSPIFNSQGQIVGTLSGGSSTCTSTSSPDFYGKFNYHWDINGTQNHQMLQPWLDPGTTGATSLVGYDPFAGLQVNFSANKLIVNKNEEVIFTDQSSGGTITSWNWNFGSGAVPSTATGKGPHTVSYTTGGYKTVSLTANNQTTTTKTNYIYVNESAMITQSTSQAIGTSTVACVIQNSNPSINSDNSYYRVFDLVNHHSINTNFELRIVDVGIQVAAAENAETGTPITIRIYTASSTNLATATLTQLHQQNFSVPNVSQVVRQFLLSNPVLIPAGSIIAVEVHTPSGQGAGTRIFLGSNSDGQNTPTFFKSTGCGIANITNLANVGSGFPNVHLVLNLWGGAPVQTSFSVTYNANNASVSGQPPVDGNLYPASNQVTVLGQGTMALANHSFAGWNFLPGGQGPTFQPGDSFTMPANNVNLFAVWRPTNTAVSEPGLDEVAIFPNPSSGLITVSSQIFNLLGAEVFDLTGRSVYKARIDPDQTNVDVSNLKNGLYLIRVETDRGCAVRKLQIQK